MEEHLGDETETCLQKRRRRERGGETERTPLGERERVHSVEMTPREGGDHLSERGRGSVRMVSQDSRIKNDSIETAHNAGETT